MFITTGIMRLHFSREFSTSEVVLSLPIDRKLQVICEFGSVKKRDF